MALLVVVCRSGWLWTLRARWTQRQCSPLAPRRRELRSLTLRELLNLPGEPGS